MTALILTAALTAVVSPQETAVPADQAAITTCFAEASATKVSESMCLDAVHRACANGATDTESSTTAFARRCAARAAAAWTAELGAARKALEAMMEPAERTALAGAQQAWEAFLTANVRAHAERYAGGTLQPVVAGEERARMTAERALELRRMIRERRDGA